jgi:hypothetical protein
MLIDGFAFADHLADGQIERDGCFIVEQRYQAKLIAAV